MTQNINILYLKLNTYIVDIFGLSRIKGGRLVIIVFFICGYLRIYIFLIIRYTF